MKTRDLPALLLAMGFPTVMAWLYFMVLPTSASEGNPVLVTVFAASKVVQFAFPLIFVLLTERYRLGLPRLTLRGMVPAVAFGLATAAAVFGLYFLVLRSSGLFGPTSEKIDQWLTKMHLSTQSGFIIMAAGMSLVHSLLEEYYWRWFVFGGLRRRLPWAWAALISGLAFMSHHVILLAFYFPGNFWVMAVPFSLGVAVGGIVWAWIYERSGSIYAAWASHCIIDLAIMAVGYDLLFDV